MLTYIAKDGTKIVLDEYEEYEEDGEVVSYWGTVCGYCLKKIGKYLDGHISDSSEACCSVCGCSTPSYWDSGDDNNDAHYVDFLPHEVILD